MIIKIKSLVFIPVVQNANIKHIQDMTILIMKL